MKKIFVVLVVGLLVAGFCSKRAFADEGCYQGMKAGMHEKMMGTMQGQMGKKMNFDEIFSRKVHFILENAAELGLSDDQLQKIKTLKVGVKKSLIKNNAEIELLDLDIEAALGKDEIDLNNIGTLIDKKYSIKSQETKAIIGAYAELKKVLNKDQMKKMHDIWNKESMEESKGMMMDGKCKKMEGKEDREHGKGMR